MFQMNAGLMMKRECFSEMLVSTYKAKKHYNPEDQHQHLHAVRTSSHE
jgi:hypothetical protein